MPNCEIISGGVKIAEKTRIPIKKYFLLFFNILIFRIFSLVKIINKRIKLEKDKIAKEQNIRIKNEELEGQNQSTNKIET